MRICSPSMAGLMGHPPVWPRRLALSCREATTCEGASTGEATPITCGGGLGLPMDVRHEAAAAPTHARPRLDRADGALLRRSSDMAWPPTAEEYGCLVINGGTGASRLQVEVARAWGATVYAGTPSFLANLGDTAREMGLDPRRDLHYRVGFSTAEALTPALRRELEATFGIELYDHCGEAQIGPLAGECRLHDGMHLHARDLFCEFLDVESGEPVEPGGTGELVATQLGPRALPLVRYAPRDVFHLLPGACACGNPALRLRFVGQAGAIRKIKGVLVHPAQVHAVTSDFPELGRFQIVVERGARYDRARLRAGTVRAPAEPEALARALAERLKSTVLIQMDVELVPEADIPEAAAPPRFSEAIVDRRTKA